MLQNSLIPIHIYRWNDVSFRKFCMADGLLSELWSQNHVVPPHKPKTLAWCQRPAHDVFRFWWTGPCTVPNLGIFFWLAAKCSLIGSPMMRISLARPLEIRSFTVSYMQLQSKVRHQQFSGIMATIQIQVAGPLCHKAILPYDCHIRSDNLWRTEISDPTGKTHKPI